ncbi:MAG: HEPN domain-containing protein [Candidatus Nanoarchaeia archaeon]|nr:HEPN domain-containing protein [Candidatus Nanoarchaeia archaeon]MDD5588376.1 HEPN domain-containing protein [Candidatus Nanoarchaeia archaeon]
MQSEKKENAKIRLEDAFEFIESAKSNMNENRFKASIDHSITACIAANDAFTIHHLEKIASMSHYEALDLHREAANKFKEEKTDLLRKLLNERHKMTYRPVKVKKQDSEDNFKNAIMFVNWIKEHL